MFWPSFSAYTVPTPPWPRSRKDFPFDLERLANDLAVSRLEDIVEGRPIMVEASVEAPFREDSRATCENFREVFDHVERPRLAGRILADEKINWPER